MAATYVFFLVLLYLTAAPGIYLALRIFSAIPAYMALVWGLTIDALIGYAVFWVYFLNPTAGVIASWIVMSASLAILLHLALSPGVRARFLNRELLRPLALMALVGLFYISVLYVCPKIGSSVIHANYRFFDGLPQDNYLPMIVAQGISQGQHLGIVATPDWHSSDRPPLQSGLYMISLPLEIFTQKKCEIQYELVGVAVQCFWIPAVWALCCALKLRARTIAFVLAACIFSGFMLINSVFVWPKLLSASLAALALAIVLKPRPETERESLWEFSLAATAGTLGMLSHAGVAFAYPAIALLALRNGFLRGWKRVILAVAIFAALMAPWSAYQKFYDPPGNRLAKWHLAGAIDLDDRTFLQALIDGYGNLTFAQYSHNKIENVKALSGPAACPVSYVWPTRSQEFYHLARTFGILNIGWLILIAIAAGRKNFGEPSIERKSLGLGWQILIAVAGDGNNLRETSAAKNLLSIAALSVLIWILALFNPGSTVLPGGSYAMVLFLFVALSILIAQLPLWAVIGTLSIEIVHFAATWILFDLPNGLSLLPAMLVACALFAIGIVIVLIDLASHAEPA